MNDEKKDMKVVEEVIDPLVQHDELRGIKIHDDPTEPLTDDECSEESR